MKAEDTISALQRLRGENDEAVVEKGEEERIEESLASDYFMHLSIERDRRWLNETRRGKWITRRMDMIRRGHLEWDWSIELTYS